MRNTRASRPSGESAISLRAGGAPGGQPSNST
ncbi:Uncharacterised protein [Bordetella pertussis]|nr:Uncharacterised protein [Bordetella pertussis]